VSTELTPKEKAAILLISLGKEHAAQLYKHLSDDEISQMTLSIASTRRVEPEVREQIISEFYDMCVAQKYISEGGIEYARSILEEAIGKEKAQSIIYKLSSSLEARPFDFIRRADPVQVLNVLQYEHPQTAALVLSYLDPKRAAEVLGALPQEAHPDIIARIAKMGNASPEYVKEAERILERKISSMGFSESTKVGGIDTVVGIVNSLDRTSEKRILEGLETDDQELAEEIRKHMFVFEDVAKLSAQAIQRVLKEVSNQDIAIALKLATPDVNKVIFGNISKRLADMIKDDMEVMGPVRVRDVEDAQQRIVNTIRKLEDMGEIIIARGDGDEMVV